MPLQKKERTRIKATSRCRKECLKKYMKPNLKDYLGNTFREKVDYCISSYYVCCKPEVEKEQTQKQDILKRCREKILKSKDGDL